MTIVWNEALVGFAAMTEHGPPKTDMDSRSRLRKNKLRENYEWGVQRGEAPLRFSSSPKNGGHRGLKPKKE